jgi:hypothetical protein
MLVSLRMTLVTPLGVSPCQFGPAIMKLELIRFRGQLAAWAGQVSS